LTLTGYHRVFWDSPVHRIYFKTLLALEGYMTITDRIEVNSKIMMGKPVIRGTRVTVELVLRKLGEGATEAELLDAYPQLKKEDIQAAMAYAADTLAHEETVLLKNQA
jgi:uncharacterized protein (DUF433 family)